MNVGYALTINGEYESTSHNLAEDVKEKHILLTFLVDI